MDSSFEQSAMSGIEQAVEVNKSVAAMLELSEGNFVSDGVDNERKQMRCQKTSITGKVSEDVLDNNRVRSVDSSRLPTSGKACNLQDAAVAGNFSQISAGNSSSHVERSNGLEPELEHFNKQTPGTDNLNSSRRLPSVSTVGTISSTHGSEKEGAMSNNQSLAKNIARQQAAAKVGRNYPSELTLFPYEHFVKLYNFDKVELRPFGLVNLGNSCYANAVLQCLAFTRPLTAYLMEGLHSRNCSKKEWCFMCEFEKLILECRRGKSHLSPTGILSHLHDIGSSFGPGREEDAHEFLRYAIDTMQSASMKEARKNGVCGLPEETTLVQLIFGGYLRSKIKCTKCQGSSEQCERILDLTVEIDGDINTLEEALHRFTSTEVLDGDNRYNCSRCKSYERAKKKLTISEGPNILTIALKRYQSGNFGKINKAVRFPEHLNLSNYMSTADDNSPVYQLYAVVVHRDVMNAAFSGHYVCYVKDTQGKWHKMDDSQVKPVSLEKVLSKCAYMLFYARCSPRAPNSVRKIMLAQDPSRTRKARQMVDPGPVSLEGGSYLSRHQGGQLSKDHIVYDLTYTLDTFAGSSYTVVESPSPSDSSSLLSNSDAGSTSTFSSDSTDSTRNSTSMEEYDYIFGSSDQMYPVSTVVIPEEHELSYSRQRSSLNPSSSSQYVDQASEVEMLNQHKDSRGGWDEGDGMPFFYSNQGKHHGSSRSSTSSTSSNSSNRKLTEQRRTIGEVDHGPGEVHGSILIRRIAQAIY
uniref:USP domain-containing protein n=2 Tax=Oryza brachyantha TaxID=4533 RepID=J3MY95_ORYBR